MDTEYLMTELPDLKGTGEQVTYPQMVMRGQTGTRELAKYIAQKCAFAKGVTEGVICEIGEALAHELAMGFSVKIEGLGTFTPALALRNGKQREETGEDATHRNAQSIRVGKVNFRADGELLADINSQCNLVRAPGKAARSSQKYSPEYRLELAKKYLEEHPYLTVQTYCQLTGLLPTTAGTELRKWAGMAHSGIGTSGRGSHKVYVKA